MRNLNWVIIILTMFYAIIQFYSGEIVFGFMNLSCSLIGIDLFYLIPSKEEDEDLDDEVRF